MITVRSENLRGALLMTAAMVGFAICDMFIKLMAGALPPWQVIALMGLCGAPLSALLVLARREPLFPRAILTRPVLLRNCGELIGTMGFVTAISYMPLSQASAVLQAQPLIVTMGAALILGEQVGWRRWSAIALGFVGVLLVVQPGGAAFDPFALAAFGGVLGLAVRDLATRRIPQELSSYQLSLLGFLTLMPTGLLLSLVIDVPAVWPDPRHWAYLAGAVIGTALAYYCVVGAMRSGDVSAVTPFRYTRMLFALIIGMVIFSERPDALMLAGAGLIVGSGLYTVWRERRLARAARLTPPGAGI